jgi:hypothetical protein
MDIEYRKKWDAYVAKIEMLESNNNSDIIYWDVKYGIPMVSNRDYIYCREFKGQTDNFPSFFKYQLKSRRLRKRRRLHRYSEQNIRKRQGVGPRAQVQGPR